jgi:hypothetical protein
MSISGDDKLFVVSLNNTSQPKPIKYAKNKHGFGGNDADNNQYLFELVINGENIGKKYFHNLESTKYSHLIKITHKILLNDIDTYKASITVNPNDSPMTYEMEGIINKNESSSTQRSTNMYIEFTKNDNGYCMCSCFYTGLDGNKIFASPPI